MSPDQITRFSDHAAPFAAGILEACRRFAINTPQRQAMFLAQVAHESEDFRYVREIWGPTDQQRRYEPPGALAAQLGNTQPGDGRRFLGRGLIQITGRANTRACSMFVFGDDRLVQDPRWLETVDGAPLSAGWFWSAHDCNELADAGDIEHVTRRINGGLNGLVERAKLFTLAQRVLGLI